jgi:hypothetical protein
VNEETTTETVTELFGELVSIPRRTGVIVGLTDSNVTAEQVQVILEGLNIRFPAVTFAVVAGGASVAFEWDEPDEETPCNP